MGNSSFNQVIAAVRGFSPIRGFLTLGWTESTTRAGVINFVSRAIAGHDAPVCPDEQVDPP